MSASHTISALAHWRPANKAYVLLATPLESGTCTAITVSPLYEDPLLASYGVLVNGIKILECSPASEKTLPAPVAINPGDFLAFQRHEGAKKARANVLSVVFVMTGKRTLQRCPVCDKDAPHACGRCLYIRYCSKECQRNAWPTHRAECRLFEQKLRATSEALSTPEEQKNDTVYLWFSEHRFLTDPGPFPPWRVGGEEKLVTFATSDKSARPLDTDAKFVGIAD